MLSRKHRLSKDQDFKRVYKKAPKIKGVFLSIRSFSNQKDLTRFGLVVPNKILSKAVKRNLIKRRLREVLREYLDKVKPGFDVIIKLERVPPVIKLERAPQGIKFEKLKERNLSLEIESLLKRSRLIR